MTNIAKLSQSTPFVNFGLDHEDRRYRNIQTDEEMVYFFHEMLSKYQEHPILPLYIYELIEFGVKKNINCIIPRSL